MDHGLHAEAPQQTVSASALVAGHLFKLVFQHPGSSPQIYRLITMAVRPFFVAPPTSAS